MASERMPDYALLCDQCEAVDLPALLSGEADESHERKMDEVWASSACSLCRLIVECWHDADSKFGRDGEQHLTPCRLYTSPIALPKLGFEEPKCFLVVEFGYNIGHQYSKSFVSQGRTAI